MSPTSKRKKNLLFLVQFDNLVSKFRDRKINKSVLFVGNDVYTDATAKASAKSPFDGNVVYNFEAMVCIYMIGLIYKIMIRLVLNMYYLYIL